MRRTEVILVVDPPSGWLYGFPKAIPTTIETEQERSDWFIKQGYPERLIAQGMLRHCRYWEHRIDKDD